MLRDKLEDAENAKMDVQLIREALIEENAAAQKSLDEATLKEQQFAKSPSGDFMKDYRVFGA